MSSSHPARFILIGTMNPEEGDLRPQLLDRFGLAVDARRRCPTRRTAPRSSGGASRYEADPVAFAARWADEERALRERDGRGACAVCPRVVLAGRSAGPDRAHLHRGRCRRAARRSHDSRPPARSPPTAGRIDCARSADIRTAAALALLHRSRQPQPPDAPLSERVNDLLREYEEQGENTSDDAPPQTPDDTNDSDDRQRSFNHLRRRAYPSFSLPKDVHDRTKSAEGRRGASTPHAGVGRAGALTDAVPDEGSLAVAATIRAAAAHQWDHHEGESSRSGMAVQVRPEDVRLRHREPPAGHCVLFVVDASGSMAAERRMAVAKGAALDLLSDAISGATTSA